MLPGLLQRATVLLTRTLTAAGRASLWRDRQGVAAVEMALVSTFFLAPITAGLVGSGIAIRARMLVDRGMQAGLMYAWANPTASTTTIQSRAVAGAGTPDVGVVSATASIACYCIPVTGTRSGATAVSCTSTCSTSGYVLATYATVATTTSFTPLFYQYYGSSFTVSASGTVRIQ